MAAIEVIMTVNEKIQKAASHADIFGRLAGINETEKLRELRRSFAYLARTVHSDFAAPEDKSAADQVFCRLVKSRAAAEDAIKSGNYENSKLKEFGDAGFLKSALAEYFMDDVPFQQGDFSTLFIARTNNDPKKKVLVKVAIDPTFNPWLEREVQIAARFHEAKAGEDLAKIAPFIQKITDTFQVTGDRGIKRKVNVLNFSPEQVTLTEVLEAFPKGLEPMDATWIFRRIIGQVIAAEMINVIHGAIVPDHILVHPLTHEPVHIGWGHAIEAGGKLRQIIGRFKDYYPLEVFAKEICDQRTDLFMAGKIMVALLGGDVGRGSLPSGLPKEAERIIRACLEPKPERRPKNGLEVMKNFTRAVRSAWGKQYRPLNMPIHN